MKMIVNAFFIAFCLMTGSSIAQESQEDWSFVAQVADIQKTTNLESPSAFLVATLTNYDHLFNRLLIAQPRFDQNAGELTFMKLPLPNGQSATYKVFKTPVMEAGLQMKFPHIRSYTLVGVTNPHSIAKVDFGDHGFHAMIRTAGESPVFIDPYRLEDQLYMVYHKKDYPQPTEVFHCGTEFDPIEVSGNERRSQGDCTFREYRLALACTGEYATFHGGTVSGVMSAFTTSMNRVNGVFEKDAGITMILVSNNDQLIFLDAGTDPYTNGNGSTMLGQNQTTCDDIIGTANYDIGHVFSTGGGGVASLRSPCNSNRKARGVTGRGSPVGDPFDIDYVAHEMGHQYGGNHTQNNSCNRSYASYEPGSASTIMGYAGICNPNVQSNSDDYYHAINLDEFAAFVTNGSTGGSCDNVLSSANSGPTANAGADYTVPFGTPFALTGTGSDPDSNPLTYCWEQYNNEVSTQPPSSTSTVGPNFRSKDPKTSPVRELPEKGLPNTWEVVSDVDRTFDFRLTVRDYNSGLGYGCTEEDDMQVTTFSESGPFVVLTPNGGEIWQGGSSKTVTWDVASTTAAPVSCSQVNILLSVDNGNTYPYTLASSTPNDGSQSVTIPVVSNTQARIKIKAVGNIFFDVSNQTFEIDLGNCPDDDLVFDTDPIPTGSYYANNSILASVDVEHSANVLFQSFEINLAGDFSVPLGAEFEAVIGACP